MDVSDESGAESFSAFSEASSFLRWASKRAAPLGFAGISIAAFLWLDFIRTFGIPVGFLSVGLLTGLPALFAAVSLLTMALSVFLIVPATVLWSKLYEDGPSLASWSRSVMVKSVDTGSAGEVDGQESAPVVSGRAPDLFRLWMSLGALFALFPVLLLGMLFVFHLDISPTLIVVILVLGAGVGMWSLWPMCKRAAGGRKVSFSFRGHLLGALLMQFAAFFQVFLVALDQQKNTDIWSVGGTALGYLVVVIAVLLAQLFVAVRVVKGPFPNLLRHTLLGVTVAVGVLSLIPRLGGLFANYALRTHGPDGATCIVLSIALPQPSTTDNFKGLRRAPNDPHTDPFGFVVRIDDTYFAKSKAFDPTVALIPANQVLGASACGPTRVEQAATHTPVTTAAPQGSPAAVNR